MNLKSFKKYLIPSLSRDFGLVITFFILLCLMLLVLIGFRVYKDQEKQSLIALDVITKKIDRTINDDFSYVEYQMQYIGNQIKENGDRNNFVKKLLATFDMNIKSNVAVTWNMFSWVNKDGFLTIDGTKGILEKPKDLRKRDYLPNTVRHPGKMLAGSPVFGAVSNQWLIPAGFGVVDKNDNYVGSIVFGFDIGNLIYKLETVVADPAVDFVLLDKKNHVLLKSSNSSFSQEKIASLLTLKSKGVISRGNIFDQNKSLVVVGNLEKYQFRILLQYNPKIFYSQFWTKFSFYALQLFLFCVVVSLILLAIRIRIILPITNLAKAADSISKGNLDVNIPRYKAFEMISLTKALLNIKRYAKHEFELKKKIKESEEEAKKANIVKDNLMKLISHDLRNYSNRINHLSNSIKIDETDLDLKNKVELKSQSEELSNFVDDLLDPSQQKTGILKVGRRVNLDLARFFDDLHFLHSYYLKEQKVTLRIDLPENFRPLPCDKRRFKQIMMNLLGNAAKYTNEGGLITISADLCDENYRIIPRENNINSKQSAFMLVAISDNGIGMTKEQVQMMLNGNGYNIEKTGLNKPIDSYGIGMKTVMQLVEGHNAKMEVESQKAAVVNQQMTKSADLQQLQKTSGTTFRLFFPLNVEVFDVADAIEERTINVLIVDDQEVNLLMTRFLLEKEIKNIVCKVAKSADEALEVIKEQNKSNIKFDLILTDIQMPNIDGFELAKMIRKTDQEIPIIAYSSTISDINTERFHPEINQFLSKPIKNYLLVKAVKKWTLRKEEKQELTEEELEIVRGKTIILADDEALNLMLMRKMLENYGINVKTVTNGRELLEKYKDDRDFALIVSDIKMPIIDGLKATKEIRDEEIKNNLYHQMPIITYSGNSDKDSIYEAFRAGADDYYIKGDAKEKLIKMIAFWLKANQQNNSAALKVNDKEVVKSEVKQKEVNQKNSNEFFDDELIKIFIRDSKRLILEMKQANEVKDLKRLSFASHALKGICGVAKVDELFKHVSYINDIVKNNALVDEEDLAKTNDLLEKTVLELGA